jgi:HEAT repeat protein
VAIVAGVAVVLPARAPVAEAAAATQPTAATPNDPGSILLSKTAAQADRDEAALQLLDFQTPEARATLLNALRNGGHDVLLALARALADDPHPDPQFVEPLAALLGGERILNDAAARALARLGNVPAARQHLLDFVQDGHETVGSRAAVVHALGSIVDKRVAAELVNLLSDPHEADAIQAAAAAALLDMTGLGDLGSQPDAWKKWFDADSGKSDEAWRLMVYETRDARLQSIADHHSRLLAQLDAILTDQFQNAPDKNIAVMHDMNSTEPEIRAIGARLIRDAFLQGTAVPTDVQEQRLTALVSDSDPQVRLEAARTLKAINFSAAFDAMLAQLSRERNTDVKIALIGALAQVGDLRAMPVLRKLLHDPSFAVATAAAEGLRALAPALFKSDANAAHDLATELWSIYQQRANEPGSPEFQAACVEALAPLRESSLVLPLTRLLDPDQTEHMRAAALHALGELADPNTDDAIRGWLGQEPDPTVRLDAIDALGKTGSFGADADALYSFFGPQSTERDPTVRDRAWTVFQGLLPGAPKQVLNQWVQRLAREPEHRLAVLLELDRKLAADNDQENLAPAEENTGDTYIKLGQPDDAAKFFKKALDYYQQQHVANVVTEGLVTEYMNALLKAKKYPDAARFAEQVISANRADQQTMGQIIVQEADTLRAAADQNPSGTDRADALRLIGEALKMQPPLDDSYQDDLRNLQKELLQKPSPQ